MPSRFERKLREHLHREAGAVRVLPHALTLRMRQGSESRRGFAIVPQLAMACGLLLFAGLLAYGAGASRAGGRAPAGRLPAPTAVTATLPPTASPPSSPTALEPGPFGCSDHAGGSFSASSQLVAVRAAHHPGYDRITFEFVGALPAYTVAAQSTAAFVRDASGQPVSLNGTAGLKVTFHGVDLSAAISEDQHPLLPVMLEIRNIGNFERVVSFGVGLASPSCLRVLELSGPTRLVVDVQTPAAAG